MKNYLQAKGQSWQAAYFENETKKPKTIKFTHHSKKNPHPSSAKPTTAKTCSLNSLTTGKKAIDIPQYQITLKPIKTRLFLIHIYYNNWNKKPSTVATFTMEKNSKKREAPFAKLTIATIMAKVIFSLLFSSSS